MNFVKKVNEISNKVGKFVEKTYNIAKDKSGKLIEKTKIKIKVNENEKDIYERYIEIGRIAYNLYKTGDESVKGFSKECERIDEINNGILETEVLELQIKDLRKCDNCEHIINIDDKFCELCGDGQKPIKTNIVREDEPYTEPKDGNNTCKSCGNVVSSKIMFCSKCGYEF